MPQSPIRLISTDFDGTLLEVEAAPLVPSQLIDKITLLCEQGAVWAINTGRSLDLTLMGLKEGGFPITPEYILANEREIYVARGDGGTTPADWEPLGDWNQRCYRALEEMHHAAGNLIRRACDAFEKSGGGKVVHEHGRPAGVIASTIKGMDAFCETLNFLSGSQPLLGYQRNSIYLRFSHSGYDKGSSLRHLAAHLGIARDQIFAVGDQHNDLPMLEARNAGMLACPLNAIESVRQRVLDHGGYVAESPYGFGVLEALNHFDGTAALERQESAA